MPEFASQRSATEVVFPKNLAIYCQPFWGSGSVFPFAIAFLLTRFQFDARSGFQGCEHKHDLQYRLWGIVRPNLPQPCRSWTCNSG
jgi:hypothetical protein